MLQVPLSALQERDIATVYCAIMFDQQLFSIPKRLV